MNKKMVEKYVDSLYISYRSLGECKESLNKMIEIYGEDAEIRLEEYYDSVDVNVYAKVLETDAEYEKRLTKESDQREIQRTRELAQYLELKARFEAED